MNKIGLYAICRNELKFVDKWIENVFDADYICVLDTGSTDGTFEKLCEYSDKYPDKIIVKQKEIIPWRFDVARNESMNLVPDDANILFSTDLDELLAGDWAKTIRESWKENTTRGFYKYAWSHTPTGENTDVFRYDKLHSRRYRWKFPVHEVLWPDESWGEDEKEVSINYDSFMLHHYPDNSKPRGYYFDLLKLAVEENPDNCHEHMLLAREYLINNDLDNALKEYLFTLNMPNIDDELYELVLRDSLGRCADIYMKKHDYDEVIWYCHEFIKVDNTYREPYYILADCYIALELYGLAEAMILAADKYCVRHYTWVERAPTWVNWREDLLSIINYKLGRYDEAIRLIQDALKHEPDNTQMLKNYNEYLTAKLNELSTKLNN